MIGFRSAVLVIAGPIAVNISSNASQFMRSIWLYAAVSSTRNSSTNIYTPLSFLLLIHSLVRPLFHPLSPDSSFVHSSNKSTTRKQVAALFRREKFILLVFTFLRGKSLELAALVTLLPRLPVNYHKLSRSSLAIWPCE